jgi:hypothetical protein
MTTFLDVDDIRRDLGDVETAPTDDRITTLIERAEAAVDAEVRSAGYADTAGLIEAGTSVVLIEQVLSEMVCAVLLNPQGLRSFSKTEGPWSGSQRFADRPPGRVAITSSQRRTLGIGGGAFTINAAAGATPPGPDRVRGTP